MWERIQSTADIELLADELDTWEAFESNSWAVRKYGSIEDARWDIMRDEQEEDCDD